MRSITQVKVPKRSLAGYEQLVGADSVNLLLERAKRLSNRFQDVRVWNVSSTAKGGGVAEMLYSILGYGDELNAKISWLVISGDTEFFVVTKRIHNGIHASPGDGRALGPRQVATYEKVLAENLPALKEYIRLGDIVILHDPQTAGLAGELKKMGCHVIWRSHIGHENLENEYVNRSWNFLKPYLESVDAFVFSRKEYVPRWAEDRPVFVISPSIDPFSVKNQSMSQETAEAIVYHIGLVSNCSKPVAPLEFVRSNGERGVVKRYADRIGAGPLPPMGQPMVVQISRWDRLKDMLGVMTGFADYVIDGLECSLALVGPNVHGVTDDPEGVQVFNECLDAWRSLPHFKRRRIQLVCLPMTDLEENAAMVNAIQRYASIVVQKSLYEGFGLTVTEAMFKEKPVVASAIGGIKDQISHLDNGLLISDETNLQEFGEAVHRLLKEHQLAVKLAKNARQKVIERFLPVFHLNCYLNIFEHLLPH